MQAQSVLASEFYVSITGQKQGLFHGESTRASHSNQILGLKYLFEATTNRDTATGQLSGKRQYRPITFQKEWGAATVQIYKALATNEALTNVTFTFYDTNSDGEESISFRVILTGASIASIKHHVGDTMPDGSLNGQKLEDVGVSFRTITILDKNTVATDSVQAKAAPAPARRLPNSTQAAKRVVVAALATRRR